MRPSSGPFFVSQFCCFAISSLYWPSSTMPRSFRIWSTSSITGSCRAARAADAAPRADTSAHTPAHTVSVRVTTVPSSGTPADGPAAGCRLRQT